MNGLTLQQVESTKCLGLTIDQFLTWRNHLQSVRQEVGCSIRILKRIRPFVGLEHLIKVYRSIIYSVRQKVGCGIRILKMIRPFVGLDHLINVYRSMVEPYFTYCYIVWDSFSDTLVDSLQKLQNRAAGVIPGASYSKHSADIRHELGWLSLSEMRQHHMALMMFKVNYGLCPSYLSDMFDVNTSRLSDDLT